jgi:hypothetical protein
VRSGLCIYVRLKGLGLSGGALGESGLYTIWRFPVIYVLRYPHRPVSSVPPANVETHSR